MGRIAKGFNLRQKANGIWHVRFTVEGRRYALSTGQTDHGLAVVEARRLYGLALEGKLPGQQLAPGQTSREPLTGPMGEWLASLETTHDPETQDTYRQYALRWCKRWPSLAEITTGALGTYARERLGQVTRKTVQKELSALRGLLLWAHEQALLAVLPEPPRLPDRALGTRVSTRAPKATPLSPAEIEAILRELPEWSSDHPERYAVRAYFEVAAETGLRQATLAGLSVPEHWRRGQAVLRFPDELDKVRWGREVPLSARALAALERVAPVEGLVFGHHDIRAWLRPAARRAGVPEERARLLVPYDLRHSRATSLLAAGASLPGVQHLLGHRLASTTDRYTHPDASHARAALALVGALPPVRPSGPIVGPRGWWGYRCDGAPERESRPLSPRESSPCAKGGT